GEWWTAFIEADGPGREALLAKKPKPETGGDAPKKRSRRRNSRSKQKSAVPVEGMQ
ncbi:MAG TPA: hypothetical protein VHK70_02760, partial [Burkholderiaceae bacterium]|nr:hypothetical protein [Burkholderiaceae bacterium]